MDAAKAEGLLFENEDWTVTPAGLEHKRTGYFIESALLGDRRSDGLWSWPLHMAEKLWCAPALFAEAFLRAIRACAIEPDRSLALSWQAARRVPAAAPGENGREPVQLGDLLPRADELRARRNAPILGAPARALRRSTQPGGAGALRAKGDYNPSMDKRDETRTSDRTGRTPARRAARA